MTTLGWCPHFSDAFAALNRPNWMAGRVVSEDKHSAAVVCELGERTGIIPGRLLHRSETHASLPKVGDWVAVSAVSGENKVVIEAVLPRKSKLARKVTGRSMVEQVVAANLDTVFVVQALDRTFNLRRLERFLVMVNEGGACPVVLLNKSDLCENPSDLLASAKGVAGCPTIVVSARTRRGIGEIRKLLSPARTVCFVGTSGVGKSSLINRLYGEVLQDTIEVRERDGKGRHATTWREMILLPTGALVIDTPGMREFHLWHVDDGLLDTFPDIAQPAEYCQFRDCTHTHEAACAVKAAVAKGKLSPERLQSFLKLQRERSEARVGESLQARLAERKRSKSARLRHLHSTVDDEERDG